VGIPAILLALMFVNTTFLGPGERPLSGQTSHRAVWSTPDPNGIGIKVMTYNIWMGAAYRGGGRFEKPELVADRTRDIGQFIKEHEPDLVFLQEVVMESGPGSVDQAPLIAEAAGMHAWVFGEAINQGLPFYRMIRGNAILSRWPLAIVENQPMAGRSPFYQVGVGNQRTLWCKIRIGEQEVLAASVHLSSQKDQYRQMQQILDFAGERPAILAGDFNARPTDTPIKLLVDTGRFSAKLDGPWTMSSHQPDYKIDYIFAPKRWELLEHKVVQTDLSDHLPVLSTFRIPPEGSTKK
jgi:endonuclease/exonuclease/phosphatase family metal-dependent hydrolase